MPHLPGRVEWARKNQRAQWYTDRGTLPIWPAQGSNYFWMWKLWVVKSPSSQPRALRFFSALTHSHKLPGPSYRRLSETQWGPILLYIHANYMTERLKRISAKQLAVILGRYVRRKFVRGDWAFHSYTPVVFDLYRQDDVFIVWKESPKKYTFKRKIN